MKTTYLLPGIGVLMVIVRLRSIVRHLPWGTTKAVLWLCALVSLGVLVGATVRTARRLRTAPLHESERAVYTLAFIGLALAFLALGLPGFLGK